MATIADYEQAELDLTGYEERIGWRIHAAVYGVVGAALVLVNVEVALHTGADYPWSVFPVAAWAPVLAIHHRYATRWAARRILGREVLIERGRGAHAAAPAPGRPAGAELDRGRPAGRHPRW